MSEVIRFESFDGMGGHNYKVISGDKVSGYVYNVGKTSIIFDHCGLIVYIGYDLSVSNIFMYLGIE